MLRNSSLKDATIRDFSGGLNVADADQGLSSRFQVVSDNVNVDIDNSLRPRYGHELDMDFSNGMGFQFISNGTASGLAVQYDTTINSKVIALTITGVSADAKTLYLDPQGLPPTINGIPTSELTGFKDFRRSGNTFYIVVRTAATSTGTINTVGMYIAAYYDYQGDIVEMAYLQGKIICFKETGVIIAYDPNTRDFSVIWSQTLAYAIAGNPLGWGTTKYVSYDTFKQTLICLNGRGNDKPLEISFTRSSGAIVQYLVDPATGSNASVPRADFVLAASNYVLLIATDNVGGSNPTTTYVDVSAANTSGVFVGNPNPDDATQFDAGRVSASTNPIISGAAVLRDRVVIMFFDTSIIGTLGRYEGANHKPDFKDQIVQHGALNHRVIKTLGSDLLMTDIFGVPQFSQSIQSGVYVPDRISYLIDPVLTRHLADLTEETLRFKVFAVFNIKDRQYMLFVPKFDSKSSIILSNNPLKTPSDLSGEKLLLIDYPNHRFEVGDYVNLFGALPFGVLDSNDVNGTKRVAAILDENTIAVEIDTPAIVTYTLTGGGDNVRCTPVNDETIGYVLSYNPSLKIRRWHRYKSLNFDCGTVDKEGRLFFAKGNKIFRMGTIQNPIYVDRKNDYDYNYWDYTKQYKKGEIVRIQTPPVGQEVSPPYQNPNYWKSYVATQDTNVYVPGESPTTFDTYLSAYPGHWEIYTGEDIEWVVETPWSDMKNRLNSKIGKLITVDAHGTDNLIIDLFADNVKENPLEIVNNLAPQISKQFTAKSGGGFGTSNPSYGGGIQTKQQLNHAFPFKGKLIKLRIRGSSRSKLKLIAVILHYILGSIYR